MSVYTRIGGSVSAAAGLAVVALMSAPPAAAGGLDDLEPHDTWGVPITEYRLSFNNGAGFFGPVFTPNITIPAAVAYVLFLVFMTGVWIGFTTLNLLPNPAWLSPLVRTVEAISDRLYAQLGTPFISMMISATLMATTALYVLRNRGNKAWHHIAVTLVCVVVGVSIAFPVAEAAKLLGVGANAAVTSGQEIAGGPAASSSHNPTGVVIDEWVRKPVQRWTFGGQDLDSLGCGDKWTQAIRAHKPDKIKDVPLSCPGGELGKRMHDAAMNPEDSLIDSGVTTLFGLMLAFLLVRVVLKVTGVSVASLIHAAMIKLGLIGAATEGGQRFLARNAVDAPLAAMFFFGGLLSIYVGVDVAKIIAQVVPSSTYGMLLTVVLIAAAIIGARKAAKSWSRVRKRAANAAVSGAGSGSGAGSALYRPQIPGGRLLALSTAARYAMRQGRRGAAAAAAPEIAAPTEMVSKIRAAAQRAIQRRQTAAATGSASSAGGSAGSAEVATVAPSEAGQAAPAGGGISGGGGGVGTAQYARAAANQYRTQRGTFTAGRRRASPPRVAGRGRLQPTMAGAAAGAPGAAPGYGPVGYPGDPTGRPAAPAVSTTGTAGGRAPANSAVREPRQAAGSEGSIRRGQGTADEARQAARGYFRNRDSR